MSASLRLVESELLCNCCKHSLPLSAFHTDNRRSCIPRQNRSYTCIDCSTARRTRYEILPHDHPDIVAGRRVCCRCREEKSLSEFNKSKTGKMGRTTTCRTCLKAGVVKKPRKPPIEVSRRAYKRFVAFGLSSVAFKALFDAQGGRCGICHVDMELSGPDTCLDHDHANGRVRGILCRSCNWGIGQLRDDVRILAQAITYLELHGKS